MVERFGMLSEVKRVCICFLVGLLFSNGLSALVSKQEREKIKALIQKESSILASSSIGQFNSYIQGLISEVRFKIKGLSENEELNESVKEAQKAMEKLHSIWRDLVGLIRKNYVDVIEPLRKLESSPREGPVTSTYMAEADRILAVIDSYNGKFLELSKKIEEVKKIESEQIRAMESAEKGFEREVHSITNEAAGFVEAALNKALSNWKGFKRRYVDYPEEQAIPKFGCDETGKCVHYYTGGK